MTSERFKVPYKNHLLIGDLVPAGQTPTVLILHGAGKSVRTRYHLLQQSLANVDITSAVFDKIGHGETGGDLNCSSLLDRTLQSSAVIRHLKMTEPFSLFGSSMGAYTALKLTETYRVDNLVLRVPGVYAKNAYELPFNAGFSERIRLKDSWRQTDAWEIISQFTGNLLIVTAELDEVVPREIPQTLFLGATKAKSRELYEIPGSSHLINAYLNRPENAKLLNDFQTRIQRFYN